MKRQLLGPSAEASTARHPEPHPGRVMPSSLPSVIVMPIAVAGPCTASGATGRTAPMPLFELSLALPWFSAATADRNCSAR
jgi:hypothetical protein